jgi:ribonuclease P protein component
VSQQFSKSSRLLLRKDFQSMHYASKRFVGERIIVEIRENQKQFSRLGISASRHFGKAYQRNRFKRIAREAFRLNQAQLPKGIDFHIKPRKNALTADCRDIVEELTRATRI